jgi:hypothetical protein
MSKWDGQRVFGGLDGADGGTSTWGFRLSTPALGCLATAALVAALLVSPDLSGASTSPGASFTFSGSVNGHLTTPASDCTGATEHSGEIDFYHSLKGHSGKEWSVFYTAPRGGTYKNFSITSPESFSIEVNDSISESWTGKSGSFTVKGTTGTAKVLLKPQVGSSTHGLVHVTGTWNCP